jgi:outer membrane protein assembly factor BamB
VVILAVQWILTVVPGWIAPYTMFHFFGLFFPAIVGTLALAGWWLFASRLPWADRLWGFGLLVAGLAAVFVLGHPNVGMFFLIFGLPLITTACVLWLVATAFLSWPVRRAGVAVLLLLGFGGFLVVRPHEQGVWGSSFATTWRWRWALTAEDQLLADIAAGRLRKASSQPSFKVVLQPGDWPGFRGANRDGRVTGVRIAADWNEHKPRQVWQHRVGPGWSSFAVVASRLYTQEQRGPEELVVCYDAENGKQLWTHADTARFTEAMAGAGPRATPTFADGKIYAQGATGLLNCLDAASGKAVWQRDLKADAGAKVPMWGFAGSPLVVRGLVIVAGGLDGKGVLAYDAASGEPAWSAATGQEGYSSPHLARLRDTEQVLMMTQQGLAGYEPNDGRLLWQHDWPSAMPRMIQPTVLDDGDLLMGTSNGMGTRRIHVQHDGDAWKVEEVRTMRALKPYYNDQVVYGRHVYGFDNNFFTCVSLEDGKGMWRARDYGDGQVLLLADQGLLLVLSEKGEAALVEATPDGHRERCRFQALKAKTWNHPVVAHGKLFVRNGEEAACYELIEEGKSGR